MPLPGDVDDQIMSSYTRVPSTWELAAGTGRGTAVRPAKGGRATLTVRWPSATGARLIPKASSSIVMTVSRADGTGKITKIVDRPLYATSITTILTGLPYGDLQVAVGQAFPQLRDFGVVRAQGAVTVTEKVRGTMSISMDPTKADRGG